MPHIMRSTLSSIPSLVILGLTSLLACGGRVDLPLEEGSLPAPEHELTGDDGLFIPPQIPGVDRIAEGLGAPSAIGLSPRDIVFTTRATMVSGELVEAGGLYVRDKLVGVPLLISLDGRGAAYESLAVDSDEAFVGTSDGRVIVMPLRGGTSRTIVEAESPLAAVTVSGMSVYYATTKGNVFRAPRVGGKSVPIGTVSTAVRGIEVDGEAVYVATTDAIVRFEKNDGHVVEGVAAGAPCAMVRAGRKLFWTSQPSTQPVSGASGAVLRLALDEGDVQAVVVGAYGACAIVSDASSVYFATTRVDAGLMRAPILGGTPEKVAGSLTALTKPGAVAVDATHVYWLTTTSVLRSKK
jgi:hypothetical protein